MVKYAEDKRVKLMRKKGTKKPKVFRHYIKVLKKLYQANSGQDQGKIENKSSEEVPSLKHAHDREKEKAKEKEGLPKKPIEKGPLKRKSGKNKANKPLSKKAKRDKSHEQLGRDDKSPQKNTGNGKEKNKSSKQNAAKNTPSKAKKRALTDKHSKAVVQKAHVFDVELSDSSNSEENDPTYEYKEVNHDERWREGKEDATIHQTVKAAPKRNKSSLKSEGGQGIEGKECNLMLALI
ncbi:hypothetical protein Cgig2_011762 [Carnegiea gigantea]|uniref:Uncharacterized protein n=1 Tax=Carnegiea gigantea TaxID=171969 RepID=A0A9Q1GVK4_9CARY|nr:hypothetical protein Cgig2_011762 [Carnegiea gigantea]